MAAGTPTIPVVGPRQPCPCGSGKRYKACHGKAAARESVRLVTRPFEGLPGECDWVALREVVPAATAPLTLRPDALAGVARRTPEPSVSVSDQTLRVSVA